MLVEGQGVLGGETSGHLLCLDRASTGDGIVSALQVLESMRRRGQDLHALLEGFEKVAQKTANVRVQNGSRPHEAAAVKSELERAQAQLAGRGRAFMRAPGTEPVVRVTVEADDPALVQQLLDHLSAAVRSAA